MNITMTDKSLKTSNSILTRSRIVANRPFDQVLESYFQCQQALIFKVINNIYTHQNSTQSLKNISLEFTGNDSIKGFEGFDFKKCNQS